MSDTSRAGGRLKYIVIALAVVIGAGILGFYMWYRNLPEIDERLYVFRTATGAEADVFINSVHVGKTPLTLTFEELKNRFNPGLNPAAWPPEYNEYGESSGPGYSRQMYIKDALPEKGINEHIFYFDEKEAGVPDVRGAFALHIEGPEGKIGVLHGDDSRGEHGIIKSENGYVKGRRETNTYSITFNTN